MFIQRTHTTTRHSALSTAPSRQLSLYAGGRAVVAVTEMPWNAGSALPGEEGLQQCVDGFSYFGIKVDAAAAFALHSVRGQLRGTLLHLDAS